MGQNLADKIFVEELLAVEQRGATGVLRVRAEGICTEVHVRDGLVVFVAGGLPSDSVGRELVRRGLLTVEQYNQVVEKRMAVHGRRKFGDVALELGVIDEDGLIRVLDGQVGHKLARCLHWDRARVSFDESADVMPEPRGGGQRGSALVLPAARLHYSVERMRQRIGDAWDEPLVFDDVSVAKKLTLGEQDAAWVASLRAGKVPSRLVKTKEDGRKLASLVVALWLLGAVALPGTELDEAMEDEDFEVSLAGEVGVRSSRDRLLADSAFLQGRELFALGEYGAASDAFETAASLRPRAREYALAHAWSRYLDAGDDDETNQLELLALCDAALAQDRHLSLAYHVRASLALARGERAQAHGDLTLALAFDPSDEVSARMLDDLGAA